MPAPTAPDPDTLDKMKSLPGRAWVSIALVLGATLLNAFNDNLLKMMLVGLAPKVVSGALGENIGVWLGAMILLPFILFGPLSGYFADRYSKRAVILAMLVAQSHILLLAGLCFHLALGELSIILALGAFFLLAVQSTFYSPGKMGILKEVVGSRRLGFTVGWLQMVTMIGILAGLGVGGAWFDKLYNEHGNPWMAAAEPIWWLFGVAVVAMVAGFYIQRTPAHPAVKYRHALWWEHFTHLKESLSYPPMRRAFLGNSTYWFVASMAAAMFVDIGLALYPDQMVGGAATASSKMTLMVGVGTVVGSLFISWVNRRSLQLGMIPLGALGLAGALFYAGLTPVGTVRFDWALALVGFMGGCYMVPIQTFIQDTADAEKRGRVLASMNLLDSVAGVLGVATLVALKAMGFSFQWQFWLLGVLMLVATVYIVQLLPHYLLRFIALAIVRSIYKVKSVHHERVPKDGGTMLLPNHVSYVDAFIMGASCTRQVRFVMWDALYNIPAMTWFVKLCGTVPISPTRAKDAIRTVAAALKEGRIVCLFPEGQITRHGLVNDLRKGYELMARQGDAQVVPVYMDGLYGSIFSFEGGLFFKKWPKSLRYPIKVYFGHPIPAKQATPEAVRAQMLALSAEALMTRKEFESTDNGDKQQIIGNALRLMETEWVRQGETLLCLAPVSSVIHQTLVAFAEMKGRVRVVTEAASVIGCAEQSVVAVGDASLHEKLAGVSEWTRLGKYAMLWADAQYPVSEDITIYRGLLHSQTGALIATCVPNPQMPDDERGLQMGIIPNTYGRLLPGYAVKTVAEGLEISILTPQNPGPVILPGIEMDDRGFLMPVGTHAMARGTEAERVDDKEITVVPL
ncbi:acyl-[acyl-carrier-protein]-phospholipid O-acyltransferase/long-chain-fatty-acid--[acyl-carrier-protein] ligase [Prosthecobacter fusiformis]|uniref:Acyl-[acyl-carrier-protein]-phospholipid O-acyltransferase/long-chain-fatty-acid--[acyl-carrier-protein] ligase n=1 Tax=Prosthecobacter fusiformis TaxID=48464 RepID=A0A4R7RME7_9BACT|nr:MFS transporter [Prosthecobacter fusiformis]TDU66580.1 acyl-[acyl-carrier-protein]-phospholipid O-acyltransferase/long-chain-fatty-acid--[acyl-carrier-protein] ligase [Prosthecobacter fusiformis]